MKYAFGVPAWFGAINVSLVLCGPPMALAFLVSFALRRWSELSQGIETLVFTMTFVCGVVVWFLGMVAWSRWTEKKNDDSERRVQ